MDAENDDKIVEKVLDELKAKLGTAVFMQNDNLIDCSAVVKENVDVAIRLAISSARADMAAKVETLSDECLKNASLNPKAYGDVYITRKRWEALKKSLGAEMGKG